MFSNPRNINLRKLHPDFFKLVEVQSAPVDVIYIRTKGAMIPVFHNYVVEQLTFPINEMYYTPPPELAVNRLRAGRTEKLEGEGSPKRVVLIIDDSYFEGNSFTHLVRLLVGKGYDRDKIYGFFLFGHNGPGRTKYDDKPIFESAREFIAEIFRDLAHSVT